MVVRTNNSAGVRKKGRPKIDIKADIFREIKATDKPLSTSDLAFRLGKAWHTIDRACLMLQIDGKIDGFKIGKMNLWRLEKK
jgi:hypothetical protein